MTTLEPQLRRRVKIDPEDLELASVAVPMAAGPIAAPANNMKTIVIVLVIVVIALLFVIIWMLRRPEPRPVHMGAPPQGFARFPPGYPPPRQDNVPERPAPIPVAPVMPPDHHTIVNTADDNELNKYMNTDKEEEEKDPEEIEVPGETVAPKTETAVAQ